MSKFFIMIAIAICSLGVVAQENKMEKMKDHQMMKDHVMMKDGKMMMVKDGKMMMMDKDMTMTNGAVVSPNGMVKMKDGKTMMMKNGEKMDMNGMMEKRKTEKNGY